MSQWKKYLAELLGTFILVFVGAGSIMAYETMGAPDTLGVAVAHGLALMVAVFAFGSISGAHINPAVTLTLWVAKKVRGIDIPGYLLSQLVGAALASLLLNVMFTDALTASMGVPELAPGISPLTGTITEAILTFLLVWTIFAVAINTDSKYKDHAGMIIGGILAGSIMVGGVLTGAALNPARWFGPALVNMNWSNWYVYLVGPMVGALLAGIAYTAIYMRNK